MGRRAKRQQAALHRDMFRSPEEQVKRYNEEQVVQRELLETQKSRYREFEFKNPYADMENVMEDMTVDMRAADYQRQQGEQQRANIMQALQGAAGGSGIAGLAQAMANQGAGLEANALNQQGLLSAADLANASNQSTVDRFNQMREVGSVQDAREQQGLDFDYQQYQDAQTYQMMLAQFLGGLLSGFPTPLSSRGKQTDTRIFM